MKSWLDQDPPANPAVAKAYWCEMNYFLSHTATGDHPDCICPPDSGHNHPLKGLLLSYLPTEEWLWSLSQSQDEIKDYSNDRGIDAVDLFVDCLFGVIPGHIPDEYWHNLSK